MSEMKVHLQPNGHAQKASRARWIYIALPLLILFVVSMVDKSNVNILLANKTFLQNLGIAGDNVTKGLIGSIFLVTYAIGQFGWGFVVDRIGAFRSGMIGIVLWVVAMFLGGAADSVSHLLWSRAILGISEGVLYPIAISLTAKWFPVNEQAKAQALWFNGNALGPVIGIPVIAMIAASYGWRESYYALGVVSLLAVIIFGLMVREKPQAHYAANPAEAALIEAGQADKATATKSSDMKSVLKNGTFWLITIAYSCISIGFYGISTFLPSYLTEARGIEFVKSAYISSAGYALAIIVQMIAGYLSDKLLKRAVFVAGASALLIGLLLLTMFVADPIVASIMSILLVGLLYMPAALTMTLLHSVASKEVMGRSSGIFGCISYLVAALGPIVVGYFTQLTGSYNGGFLALIGFIVISLIVSIALMRKGY